MSSSDYLRVGKIINTHGIKGELKVLPITDYPEERFVAGQQLVLIKADQEFNVTITKARLHKNFWLIQTKEITDLTQAESYQNGELYVDADQLPDLPAGQYYYKDILGIQIIDQKHGELGTVSDIWNLGPNDVWTVKTPAGEEILIPILPDVLLNVDLIAKVAEVDLPAGLIDED